MRRTRRMTSGERWELGLFLTMLIVGCLCLTAILSLNSVPRIFAWSVADDGAGNAGGREGRAVESRIEPLALPLEAAAIEPLARPSFLPVPLSFEDVPLPKVVVDPAPAARLKKATKPPAPAVETKTYNGQKYRFVKTLKLRVTAYAPDPRCTFPYPGTTTASGLSVKTNGGKLVAADTTLISLHSLVVVPGYAGGTAVPVLDRGGAIKGARLDVLLPTFATAKNWGSRMLEVKVYAPVGK